MSKVIDRAKPTATNHTKIATTQDNKLGITGDKSRFKTATPAPVNKNIPMFATAIITPSGNSALRKPHTTPSAAKTRLAAPIIAI